MNKNYDLYPQNLERYNIDVNPNCINESIKFIVKIISSYNTSTKQNRIDQTILVFIKLINTDNRLKNINNEDKIKRIEYLAVVSIELENRMYNYLNIYEYCDNSNFMIKIRFFIRNLDFIYTNLRLKEIIEN